MSHGARISRIQTPAMGLLGLFAAPLAFEVSRGVHKGTLQALSVTDIESMAASPTMLALVKGVEYGCLGLLVGLVGKRAWGGAVAHVLTGLAVGVVFGGTILALTVGASPEPVPAANLLSQGLNELLFPVGCSLVLFSAGVLGERLPSHDDRGTSTKEQRWR